MYWNTHYCSTVQCTIALRRNLPPPPCIVDRSRHRDHSVLNLIIVKRANTRGECCPVLRIAENMPTGKNGRYTRPGVEAAARLVDCANVETWSTTEDKYGEMLETKGGSELVDLDRYCENLVPNMQRDKCITKDELLKIVQWKFLKGKPRHALMNHLRANSTESVQEHSKAGMDLADQGDPDGAIFEISKLRGVGPATASAVLSLYRPDVFAFMDDEVIECLYNGKRGYTAAIYRNINEQCRDLAVKLGCYWNPRRVGRALWAAARISATRADDAVETKNSRKVDTTKSTGRPSKRRKKST